MPRKKTRTKYPSGQVRIIGGDWRGRRLDVLEAPGLRPTADRVRETVFNWLQWELAGRRCLDLFAGTGVLSFEALSRGAANAILVEAEPSVCQQLRSSVAALDAEERVSIHQTTWDSFLSSSEETFDLIFIDPPFSANLQQTVLRALSATDSARDSSNLSSQALVYVEAPVGAKLASFIPPNLAVVRSSSVGEVTACLLGGIKGQG